MTKKLKFIALISTLIIGAISTAKLTPSQADGAPEAPPTPQLTWLEKLSSPERDQQKASVAMLTTDRKKTVAALAAILDSPDKNKSQTSYAMKAAGVLRLDELTDQLIKNIRFLEFGQPQSFGFPSLGRDWFAAAALIRIGNPAIEPVLTHLGREDDGMTQRLLLTVLVEVEGKSVAKFLLNQAIQQNDNHIRTNLETALQTGIEMKILSPN